MIATAAFAHTASATPVVAVTGILFLAAIMSVLFMSFLFYRRSGRR